MKAGLITSALLVFQGIVSASPHASSHVEHEAYHGTHVWVKRARATGDEVLPVRIGLAQRNLDHGHDALMRISDPGSEEYGRHYSAEEVVELFAPAKETIEAVRAWLESTGISKHRISLSENKQWLQFDAYTSELEGLLRTQYHEYHHSKDGRRAIACERYHLPRDVQAHVDFVKPGLPGTFVSSVEQKRKDFSVRDAHASLNKSELSRDISKLERREASPPCSDLVTPDCYRKLYNITDTIRKAPGNSLGVYSTQFEHYNGTFLDHFFKSFVPEIPQGTRPTTKTIAGAPGYMLGQDPDGGSEADLDFQVAYPWAFPDELVDFQVYDKYYQRTSNTPAGLFNVFLDAIDGSYCNKTAFGITGNSPKYDGEIPNPHEGGYKGKLQCGIYQPPNVISVSYGGSENLLPPPYQRRMCQEFMKLGLQGTSIFFASGDGGVADSNCGSTDGYFEINFPVGCPYVTVAGGTRLPPGVPVKPGVELASNEGTLPGGVFSGGGFSNVYPRPSYQESAVQEFFDNHNPPYDYYETKYTSSRPAGATGKYNRIGRGFPDIASIAQNVAIVTRFGNDTALGTSAAAPLWAGLISRINNHRLRAGKSTLGFLNPSLYKNPDMLNDITQGMNPICNKGQPGYTPGFRCAPGWDPVTGLGSPNYGKMLEYYMSLP